MLGYGLLLELLFPAHAGVIPLTEFSRMDFYSFSPRMRG